MNFESKLIRFIYSLVTISAVVSAVAYGRNRAKHRLPDRPASPIMPDIYAVSRFDAISSIEESYMRSIKPMFEKACFNCHSQNTTFPWYYHISMVGDLIDQDIESGRASIDMTWDFPFQGSSTMLESLIKIKSSLEATTMPPLRYKILHWNEMLTDQEITYLSNWLSDGISALSTSSHHD